MSLENEGAYAVMDDVRLLEAEGHKILNFGPGADLLCIGNRRLSSMPPSPTGPRTNKDSLDLTCTVTGQPDFPTPPHVKQAGVDAINGNETTYDCTGDNSSVDLSRSHRITQHYTTFDAPIHHAKRGGREQWRLQDEDPNRAPTQGCGRPFSLPLPSPLPSSSPPLN